MESIVFPDNFFYFSCWNRTNLSLVFFRSLYKYNYYFGIRKLNNIECKIRARKYHDWKCSVMTSLKIREENLWKKQFRSTKYFLEMNTVVSIDNMLFCRLIASRFTSFFFGSTSRIRISVEWHQIVFNCHSCIRNCRINSSVYLLLFVFSPDSCFILKYRHRIDVCSVHATGMHPSWKTLFGTMLMESIPFQHRTDKVDKNLHFVEIHREDFFYVTKLKNSFISAGIIPLRIGIANLSINASNAWGGLFFFAFEKDLINNLAFEMWIQSVSSSISLSKFTS